MRTLPNVAAVAGSVLHPDSLLLRWHHQQIALPISVFISHYPYTVIVDRLLYCSREAWGPSLKHVLSFENGANISNPSPWVASMNVYVVILELLFNLFSDAYSLLAGGRAFVLGFENSLGKKPALDGAPCRLCFAISLLFLTSSHKNVSRPFN